MIFFSVVTRTGFVHGFFPCTFEFQMKSKNYGHQALVAILATSSPATDHCLNVFSSVVIFAQYTTGKPYASDDFSKYQVPVMANTQPVLAMPLNAHHLEKQWLVQCQSCPISTEIWCSLIVNVESYLIRNLQRKTVKRAAYAIKGIPYGFTLPTLKIILLFLIYALAS